MRPALMTHAERRKLIEAPFVSQTVSRRIWGGVTVTSDDGLDREYAPNVTRVSLTREDFERFDIMRDTL